MFIAGDWGTSNLRLALCGGDGVIASVDGPGIAVSAQPPDALFLRLTAEWTAEHGPLPALLCGMVGSRNGWREAPYAPCPSDLGTFGGQLLNFGLAGHAISIVPGLACTNPLGAPDVMRGEETQILGALASHPDLAHGRRLFAMPGTHTKWVVVEDGRVRHFLTSLGGELFALLRAHSTLQVAQGDYAHDARGFALGLARARQHGHAALPHLLFETRSRQLRDGMPAGEAMAFLSGLLIGADVSGALAWFDDPREVVLIGTPTLNMLYAQALQQLGIGQRSLDGGHCALAGLTRLFAEGRQPDVA